MGLENLKSAFGNIKMFESISKKTTPNIPRGFGDDLGLDDFSPNGGGMGDIYQNTQNPIGFTDSSLLSEFNGSTLGNTNFDLEWPGPVNFMVDDKATGFTLNQKNKSPSLFTGVDNLTFNGNTSLHVNGQYGDWPGPMDNWSNQKADGFTLNQIHQSPSRFVGINGESPNMNWENNKSLGGSLYGTTIEPQEQDLLPNIHAVGFTANRKHKYPTEYISVGDTQTTWLGAINFSSLYDIPSNLSNNPFGEGGAAAVDFQKINSSWTNPLTNFVFPDGFTTEMRDSELAKGFIGGGSENFANTNFYSNNFINHPGPVNFMGGFNSYYTEVNTGTGIPGFTNDFTLGGYTYGDDDKGNSLYLTDDGVGNISMIETGTYTRGGITFDDTPMVSEGGLSNFDGIPDIADGTWNTETNSATSYYDSIHSVNSISNMMYGPVNFMGGNNSYYTAVNQVIDGETQDIYDIGIPGFTNNFTAGGYTFADGLKGDSHYIGINTGTHTIPLRSGLNTTITFPGNQVEIPNFPGGYSTDTPLGKSIFVEDILGDDDQPNGEFDMIATTYFDYYGNTDPSLTFSDSGFNNLFSNSQISLRSGVSGKINKGSNKGGQTSPQFDILYNKAAWQSSANEAKYAGPTQDGSDISTLERFNIKSDLWQYNNNRQGRKGGISNIATLGIFSGASDDGFGGSNEPYIINDIGRVDGDSVFPLTRLQKHAVRTAKFLSSNKGDGFIAKMNLLGTFQTYQTIYDPGSTIANAAAPAEGLGIPSVHIRKDHGIAGGLLDIMVATTYSEYLDRRLTKKNVAFNTAFGVEQDDKKSHYAIRDLKHKPLAALAYGGADKLADMAMDFLFPSGNSGGKILDAAGITAKSGINSVKNMQSAMSHNNLPLGGIGKGDLHTLTPINTDNEDLKELQIDGMPFYFKDLRNNSLLTFRAYIEGLSENVSPNWESTNYVGRSEPVYTYTNAEREIQFTLKLFAQTKDELNMIYKKMNHLTSMCYPEYKKDFLMGESTFDPATQDESEATGVGRVRMKPPLTKLRLGDLYGVTETTVGSLCDMTGFIKSLSYSFPDNGVWEIESGKIVPKHIEISLGYQVIHSTVPNLEFAIKQSSNQNTFYGINKQLFEEEPAIII